MKNSLFVLIGSMMLSGCSQEDTTTDGTPYFKFSVADNAKLIKPEKLGSSVKYKNQAGVIREFTVDYCSIDKAGEGFASFWGASTSIDYYYDTQKTKVSYSGSDGYIAYEINFQTTPSKSNYTTYPYQFSNPKFRGSLDLSAFNYNCGDAVSVSCGIVSIDNYTSIISMQIEGRQFDNVKVFNSGTDAAVSGRTVNKVYFASDYGIIGFDEVDGTFWRRIN